MNTDDYVDLDEVEDDEAVENSFFDFDDDGGDDDNIVDLDTDDEEEDEEDADSEDDDADLGDDDVSSDDDGEDDEDTASSVNVRARPVTNLAEAYAKESATIAGDIVREKDELVTAESIPSIAFNTYSTPDASQWTIHDMVRRRRGSIREDAGASLPALFFGYPRDIEIRPPLLINPGRPVYRVDAENPPSDERWAEVRSQWSPSISPSMKARNDRLAKELREGLVIDGRDTDLLFFLWRFRNTPPIILSYLLDVPVTQVLARLRQLKRAGFVVESGIMGGPLFSATSWASKALGLQNLPIKEPSQQSFNHNTVVSMIAAMAERGEMNPFEEGNEVPSMRPPFPKWNGKDVFVPGAWGGPVDDEDIVDGFRRGFRCISELELRSAWSKWTKGNGFDAAQSFAAAKAELEKWNGRGLSPELQVGNEHLLVVQSGVSFEEHMPDLVVKMPRSVDGSPNSMCVEIEMKAKKDGADYYSQKFQDILLSGRFGEVHYFCPSASVAAHVRRGADAAVTAGVPGSIFVHEVVPTFGGREFFWRRG